MKKIFVCSYLLTKREPRRADAVTDAPVSVSEKTDEPTKAAEPAPAATLKTKDAKYTDADVDDILNRKFAEWQKKQQKAVDEAQKLATMNATQKAEYERDQLKKELDELKRVSALAEMSRTARKMLSENGITISDDLLSVMVTEDAETTKSAVDSFTQMFTEAVEAAVKDRLKGEPPRKGSGGVTSMTKEQIMGNSRPRIETEKNARKQRTV